MKWPPALIITVIYLIMAFVLLVLMGMEIIHNQTVVDRLLVTIPITGGLIAAYWFRKFSQNGSSDNDKT